MSGISLVYSVDMAHATSDDDSSMMTMMTDTEKMQILPPLIQYNNGVLLSAIECNDPNKLYIRDASSPVCIRESTYERLLERGLDITLYVEVSALDTLSLADEELA